MITLSLDHVLELHSLVVESTGGSIGLRDLGRLESAIATQTQNIFDKELYPNIVDKSAVIIRGVIADHPFVDGNKRTAMISGITLLEINNIIFSANDGEIEDFAVKVATDKLSVFEISEWLREHIKK